MTETGNPPIHPEEHLEILRALFAEVRRPRRGLVYLESVGDGMRCWTREQGQVLELFAIPPALRDAVELSLRMGIWLPPEEEHGPASSWSHRAGWGRRIGRRSGRSQEIEVGCLGSGPRTCLWLRRRVAEDPPRTGDELGLLAREQEELDSFLDERGGLLLLFAPPGVGNETLVFLATRRPERFPQIIQIQDLWGPGIPGSHLVREENRGWVIPGALKESGNQAADLVVIGPTGNPQALAQAVELALSGTKTVLSLPSQMAGMDLALWVSSGSFEERFRAALRRVLHQLDLPLLCLDCRRPATSESLFLAGLEAESTRGRKLFQGRGCALCQRTGHRGRASVFATTRLGELELETNLEAARIRLREGTLGLLRDGEVGVREAGWALRAF